MLHSWPVGFGSCHYRIYEDAEGTHVQPMVESVEPDSVKATGALCSKKGGPPPVDSVQKRQPCTRLLGNG